MKIFNKISGSNIALTTFVVLVVAIIKVLFQIYNIEFFSVNPLLTAIISGNIFILGFLLNSTLRDYKEAEKIPGDMSSSLETIYDECEMILSTKKDKSPQECINHLSKTSDLLKKWFKKEAYTQEVLYEISNFNRFWPEFEKLTQANFIVRLKNEQNNLRKMLIKANTIRDTPFYDTSYKIAKISVIFMLLILVLLTSEFFYEYLFFVCVIAFLNVFLLNLIRDLDDPFEYSKADKKDEVSLKPFDDFQKRMDLRKVEFAN